MSPTRIDYGPLILRYDTVVDGQETTVTQPCTARTVGAWGWDVREAAARGQVWDVAVLDANGDDVTFDFTCFQD